MYTHKYCIISGGGHFLFAQECYKIAVILHRKTIDKSLGREKQILCNIAEASQGLILKLLLIKMVCSLNCIRYSKFINCHTRVLA